MTETVTEATTSEKTDEITFPDEMAKMSFGMLSKQIEQRNSLVGQINAAKGDSDLLRQQIMDESTDEDIVSLRERRDAAKAAYDEAEMALYDAAMPKVKDFMADAESKVKETEEKVKELDGIIKPGTTYLRKSYGDDLAKALPSLARLKGFSTKGAGATGRRVRGYEAAVEIDGEVTGFENLAGAAKFLDLETSALQEMFFKAAGVDELKKAPNTVQFTVNYTETYDDDTTEDKTATVTCERKEQDSTPADDDETDAESHEDETASAVESL